MAIRFDSSFERAELLIRRCLTNTTAQSNNCVAFGMFNSAMDNYCSLKHFEVCNIGRDADDDSNLTLSLIYTIAEPNDVGLITPCDKMRTINLLSTVGDIYWTPTMILRVFDGEYPTTVGYDTDSGEVFFVYVRQGGMIFKYFATLTPEQLASFDDINLRKPFHIDIKPRAMFKVLDGAEGNNHLKQNLFVEFDCIHPITVDIDTDIERIF